MTEGVDLLAPTPLAVDAAPGPKASGASAGRVVTAAVILGCVAVLMLGVQPLVLGAFASEGRLDMQQLGLAATAEMLALSVVSGVLGAAAPARRLKLWGAVAVALLAIANFGFLQSRGLELVASRGISGVAAGILIWIVAGVITRSAAALRLSAIFAGAQALSQAALAITLPMFSGLFAANTGPILLGAAAILGLPLLAFVPSSLPDLPAPKAGEGALGVPAVLGLASSFFLLAGIVGMWVYVEQVAQAEGIDHGLVAMAIAGSLAMQVVGAAIAAWLGPRLPAAASLTVTTLAFLLASALIGLLGSPTAYVGGVLLFGFLWTASTPFLVPLLIRIDPTRRAALLLPAAQMLGGSLGPQVTGQFAQPTNFLPVVAAAGALFLATTITTLLASAKARRPG